MTDKLTSPELSGTGGSCPSVSPPRLLRLPEVMERVGLRRSAIYQRMSEGRFPKCRTLGRKCSVWIEAEINRWIEDVVDNLHRDDR